MAKHWNGMFYIGLLLKFSVQIEAIFFFQQEILQAGIRCFFTFERFWTLKNALAICELKTF